MDMRTEFKHAVMDQTYPYSLPELQYGYDALEPHMDAQTLKLHHDKHHAKYVDELNTALENQPSLQKKTLKDLLHDPDSLPEAVRASIGFNGGGHLNHSNFWQVLSPTPAPLSTGRLATALEDHFGGFDGFKQAFTDKASTVKGSGWTHLAADPDGGLQIVTTHNHGTLVPRGQTCLLICDMWEHAYYLKHQNRRDEYLTSFWALVDWAGVEARYGAIGG
jgi:Fe-Mn family superoxide dismutase